MRRSLGSRCTFVTLLESFGSSCLRSFSVSCVALGCGRESARPGVVDAALVASTTGLVAISVTGMTTSRPPPSRPPRRAGLRWSRFETRTSATTTSENTRRNERPVRGGRIGGSEHPSAPGRSKDGGGERRLVGPGRLCERSRAILDRRDRYGRNGGGRGGPEAGSRGGRVGASKGKAASERGSDRWPGVSGARAGSIDAAHDGYGRRPRRRAGRRGFRRPPVLPRRSLPRHGRRRGTRRPDRGHPLPAVGGT